MDNLEDIKQAIFELKNNSDKAMNNKELLCQILLDLVEEIRIERWGKNY